MLNPTELKKVLPDPVKIVEELDKYIIGQDYAKKTLALMLLNRGLLALHKQGKLHLAAGLEKSNVLLIGPTGSGKTAMIKALSIIAGVPISISDATQITAAGYIGGKVEDVLVRHVQESLDYVNDAHAELAESSTYAAYTSKLDILQHTIETGIIYIDEIDKVRSRKASDGIDVNGDMVQNELLKILESGKVSLQSSRLPLPRCGIDSVVTDNIFFIVGGAFNGLEEIINKRLTKGNTIGFTSANKEKISADSERSIFEYLENEDLVEYGFKPEFLGRVPLRTYFNQLTVPMLVQIITEPKNAIFNQYSSLFRAFGIDLVFEQDAIEEIAVIAESTKIGARSLKMLFMRTLLPDMYNIFTYPQKQLVINRALILERCKL